MNVLSLFDGMSCGRIALERCGITVTNYFASEVDKYAIQVSKANWPDIKHIGDVRFLDITFREGFTTILNWLTGERYTFKGMIDLIIGGSPCQGFSFAGKQLNFDDPRSALFFEYERLRNDCAIINPQLFFFLENVVMKQIHQDVISELMGVKPIKINSALVSAQTRKRLYWTNIPYYGTPKDKNIILKSVLETDIPQEYIHSAEAVAYMCRTVAGGRSHWHFKHHSDSDKSSCIVANIFKGVPYNVLIDRRKVNQINPSKKAGGKQPHTQDRIYHEEGKIPALTASYTRTLNVLQVREATIKGFAEIIPGECFDNTFPDSKTRRGRKMTNKANCLTATKYDFNQYLGNSIVRRLMPVECSRLQSVKDNYISGISDSQAYKMLGNGWECNTIAYMFTPLSILELL